MDYIKETAEILGVSADSIKAMPDEIHSGIQAIFDTIEVRNDEDRNQFYEALDRLWIKGSVYLELKEIAENTGISYTALRSLDYDAQQEIVFEYMADMNNYENIHRLVNKFLAVSDIEKVAKLLEISVDELHKLPFGIREKICGHYALEYDENGDNSGLTQTLKGLIFS